VLYIVVYDKTVHIIIMYTRRIEGGRNGGGGWQRLYHKINEGKAAAAVPVI
jgi:hypothetical protein